MMYDPVEKPEHYSYGSIECVEYLYDNMPMEAFIGGLEWNVKKYLHRWRYKENLCRTCVKHNGILQS